MAGVGAGEKGLTGRAILFVAALTACSPAATAASTGTFPITTAIHNTAIPTNTLAPTATPAPSPTPITGLQEVNGTRLYYEIIWQGAPLFALHGAGGPHLYFLPCMPAPA